MSRHVYFVPHLLKITFTSPPVYFTSSVLCIPFKVTFTSDHVYFASRLPRPRLRRVTSTLRHVYLASFYLATRLFSITFTFLPVCLASRFFFLPFALRHVHFAPRLLAFTFTFCPVYFPSRSFRFSWARLTFSFPPFTFVTFTSRAVFLASRLLFLSFSFSYVHFASRFSLHVHFFPRLLWDSFVSPHWMFALFILHLIYKLNGWKTQLLYTRGLSQASTLLALMHFSGILRNKGFKDLLSRTLRIIACLHAIVFVYYSLILHRFTC